MRTHIESSLVFGNCVKIDKIWTNHVFSPKNTLEASYRQPELLAKFGQKMVKIVFFVKINSKKHSVSVSESIHYVYISVQIIFEKSKNLMVFTGFRRRDVVC